MMLIPNDVHPHPDRCHPAGNAMCQHLLNNMFSVLKETFCSMLFFCLFFLFLTCVISILVHVKFLVIKKVKIHIDESSSLPQKTLLLKWLVSSRDVVLTCDFVTSYCITISHLCIINKYIHSRSEAIWKPIHNRADLKRSELFWFRHVCTDQSEDTR